MFTNRSRNIIVIVWLFCLVLVGLLAKFGPEIIEKQTIEQQKGKIF